jgi:hypothetical protein
MTTGLLSLCCAASLSAATASSADPGVPFHDVLVGISAVAAPEITEHQTPTGSSTTDYDWKGNRSYGSRFSLLSLNGRAHRWGGLVWGAELAFSTYNITPASWDVSGGGGTSVNNGSDDLAYRTIGANLIIGYEYGITKKDGLNGFIEILPYFGGGFAFADTTYNDGTSVFKEQGRGRYAECGLMVSGFLTEKNWLYGITGGISRSVGGVTVNFSGVESKLDLISVGATIGARIGYRF